MAPRIALKRLVVFRGKTTVYDERFHEGINVIHSNSNSCGKSTIADFIFFTLGGNVKEFKSVAAQCTHIYGEFLLDESTLTFRRVIQTPPPPIDVCYGGYEEAVERGPESWDTYPLRRQDKQLSISQFIFKCVGIPEAQGVSGSDITMHQLMRILYVDQLTPVSKIFRMEDFDPPILREAVGNLLCGIGDQSLFEMQLLLRTTEAEYTEVSSLLKAMQNVTSEQHIETNIGDIQKKIDELGKAKDALHEQIKNLPAEEVHTQTRRIQGERKKTIEKLAKVRGRHLALEEKKKTLAFEITDNQSYIEFLKQTLDQLEETAVTEEFLGSLRFEICPACFTELPDHPSDGCYLCKQELATEDSSTRLIQLKLDTSIQLRDSIRLQELREQDLRVLSHDVNQIAREYRTISAQVTELSHSQESDRDTEIARLNREIGATEKQIETYSRDIDTASRVEELRLQKATLGEKKNGLQDDIQRIEYSLKQRRVDVKKRVSSCALRVLAADKWQQEFGAAETLAYSFQKDVISLDGGSNFSASSNVVLKNSFMMGLFESSLLDAQFFLPRFFIMDNVEDKGMKAERSQNFQKQVLRISETSVVPHQIVLFTSMIAEDLDNDGYVVGGEYSQRRKTLDL